MKKKKIILKQFIQIYQICYQKKLIKYKIEKFIHLSALGIENAKDSNYAKSKLDGEKKN